MRWRITFHVSFLHHFKGNGIFLPYLWLNLWYSLKLSFCAKNKVYSVTFFAHFLIQYHFSYWSHSPCPESHFDLTWQTFRVYFDTLFNNIPCVPIRKSSETHRPVVLKKKKQFCRCSNWLKIVHFLVNESNISVIIQLQLSYNSQIPFFVLLLLISEKQFLCFTFFR